MIEDLSAYLQNVKTSQVDCISSWYETLDRIHAFRPILVEHDRGHFPYHLIESLKQQYQFYSGLFLSAAPAGIKYGK